MLGFYARDFRNFIRYGRQCPKVFQTIYVPPEEITSVLIPRNFAENESAKIMPGDWDMKVKALSEVKKFITIHNALSNDLSWEESGMYELYSGGKKYSEDLLRDRYVELMKVVEQVRRDGFLRSRKEISPLNFRERGGIVVHIGSQCNPIFAGTGYHRLALTMVCQLPMIPVVVGVVHEEAVTSGRIKKRGRGIWLLTEFKR